MSNYLSFAEKQNDDKEKLKKLKQEAQENLLKLAKEDIRLLTPEETPFSELSSTEKKRIIKSKITNRLDKKIKEYLNMRDDYILENAYEDFFEWLKSNSWNNQMSFTTKIKRPICFQNRKSNKLSPFQRGHHPMNKIPVHSLDYYDKHPTKFFLSQHPTTHLNHKLNDIPSFFYYQ